MLYEAISMICSECKSFTFILQCGEKYVCNVKLQSCVYISTEEKKLNVQRHEQRFKALFYRTTIMP